jgi:uncharacterized delta-60 repeat protein
MTDFGPTEQAEAVAIQSDGKIVAAGQVGGFRPNTGIGLVRYNTDGSLDSSFDGDGKLLTPNSGNLSIAAHAMAIQSNGKIVVAGSALDSSIGKFALIRYNPNGSLDTSFDGDGIVLTLIGERAGASAVAIQPDGKIIAVGSADIGAELSGFALARYNADGSLDASFDGDGKVITDFGASGAGANSVAIQSNGKIVVAGSTFPNTGFALARYNTDGSLDASFDGDGKVVTPVGDRNISASAVAIQPDGKIVAAGTAFSTVNGGGNWDFAVVRYIGDAAAARQTLFDFDGDGKADISVFRPSNGVWYLLNSQTGFSAVQFGISTDKLVPADYDGDGKADIAVFRDGTWYLLQSTNGFSAVQFGSVNDKPAPTAYLP